MGTFEHWEQFVKQKKEQLETDREKRKAAGQATELPLRHAENPKFEQKARDDKSII